MADTFHSIAATEVLSKLKVDSEAGLSQQEANIRLRLYGENKMRDSKPKNVWKILFEQFLDPIIYILGAAMFLAFIFSEWLEGFAVMVVILITALIGFFMEWQAIRSVEALQKLVQTVAKVIREKKILEIKAGLLVPGDIILLEAGDVIPADARILESKSFAVKEAVLTGESNQVEKNPDILDISTVLSEQKNMLFKATIAVRGNAKAVVTGTGINTQIGKISELTREAKKESTPLEKKLKKLSRWLIWFTLILAILISVSGYYQGKDLLLMIKTGMALAVAAIPEGLPIVATIALARGMMRLSRRKVVIKKLEAVQTLGETGIICTDKTGTLTENKMSVHHVMLSSSEFTVNEIDSAMLNNDPSFQKIMEIGLLCNNADFKNNKINGDAIEIALVEFGEKMGWNALQQREKFPRLAEIPFDAEIKKMASLHKYEQQYLICVKGALESLIEFCDYILTSQGIQEFINKNEWFEKSAQIASKGIRILAFAYREEKDEPNHNNLIEKLVFVGILGFLDPPRQDIEQAINTYKNAGIKVIMITGDHPETASKIGEEIGLLEPGYSSKKIMNGKDLPELLSLNEEQKNTLLEASIFARMVPKQKLDLIEFYQKNKAVVGMIGDGVNDAPALKKADIGIAMGIRGTEAAKEVADVILLDDKFTSTELAIRQGRTIFENIRQFVIFLLSCNLAEIISVALASFSNLPLPLLPLQILFLNLVTDVFPALALGVGKGDPEIMKQPPRDPSEPILTKKLWRATVLYGLSITSAVIGVTAYAHFKMQLSAIEVNNMAFFTLILAQLLNVFNLPRKKTSFLNNEITKNPWVWASLLFSILIMVVAYYIPVVHKVLSLVALSPNHFLIIGLFGFVSLLLSQLLKKLGLGN